MLRWWREREERRRSKAQAYADRLLYIADEIARRERERCTCCPVHGPCK